MKICIATDFHLSYRQYGLDEREQDFYRQYEKLIEEVINEKPDIFIELGDIFDEHKPKPIAIKKFEEGLEKLNNAGIKCYGIVGNHTLIRRRNYYPIDKIFEDKLRILNEDYETFDDVFICGINYHPRTHDIKDTVNTLYEKGKSCRLKILLLHQSLKKDIPIGYDFDEDKLQLNRFDYVFLGHLHKRILRYDEQTDSVIHYPGSLNSCSVVELLDEINDGRGYTVFDTDTYLLEMKNITPQREYIEYNLKDDELNDDFLDKECNRLKEQDTKPIVQLNLTTKNPKYTYDICKKLDKHCLVMKCNINTDNEETQDKQINTNKTIEEIAKETFPKKWQSNYFIELMKLLAEGNTSEAEELAEKMYNEHYNTQD